VFPLNNDLISSGLRPQKKELPVSEYSRIVLGYDKRSEAKRRGLKPLSLAQLRTINQLSSYQPAKTI
jgi:hypothetical protein